MSCIICNHSLDESKTCKVGSKGLKNLIQCSIDRNDNLAETFRNVETITLHTVCRAKYIHRKFSGKLAVVNITPPNFGPEVNFEYVSTVRENTNFNAARPNVGVHAAETSSEGNVVNITPPNFGPEVNFEYISTVRESTNFNAARPNVAVTKTPIERNVVSDDYQVTTLAENELGFSMRTLYVHKLDNTQHNCMVKSEITSLTADFTSESAYGNNINTGMKYFPSREDNSLVPTNIYTTNVDNDSTVATKKNIKHRSQTFDDDDPTKPFPFQHRCFLCAKNFGRGKSTLVQTISKESTQQKILAALKKNVRNVKILQRIEGVDLLQAKVRCHRNCISALYCQRETSGRKGRPLCPLLQLAMEKIYRYIEVSDCTEFTSTQLTSASLHGDEYQPPWSSVEKKLAAKYNGKIYFTRHGRNTVVTLLKDSSMVMQPWNWNDTDMEKQMENVKKKKRKAIQKEFVQVDIVMNENKYYVEVTPQDNDDDFINETFQSSENEADITESNDNDFIDTLQTIKAEADASEDDNDETCIDDDDNAADKTVNDDNTKIHMEKNEADASEDDNDETCIDDDDNAADKTVNDDNTKKEMKEFATNVTTKDPTNSSAALNEAKNSPELNDIKTVTTLNAKTERTTANGRTKFAVEFDKNKCNISVKSRSKIPESVLKNEKDNSTENKYLSTKKEQHCHISVDNDVDSKTRFKKKISCRSQNPTETLSLEHICLFCEKSIIDERRKPKESRKIVSVISKDSTQEKILALLKKNPSLKNIKTLHRIEGVDLLQAKAHYHRSCFSVLLSQRGINDRRGRPVCPLLTAAMEKIYRFIEESDRTEFTSSELTSKGVQGDYRPNWSRIAKRMLQKYAGKIYLTQVPGHSTIVTLAKDGGSLGGMIGQPWNLNSTDLGGQIEDLTAQRKKTKCFKTKTLLAAHTKTIKNKFKKKIITDDHNDDLLDDTFNCEENASDVEITSNLQSICHICLSSDRKLEDLGDYRDILTKLCPDVLIQDYEPKMFLLCWECIARLKNIQIFQKKIMDARKFWSSEVQVQEPPKSLSTLFITTPSTALVSYLDDKEKDKKVQEYIEPEEVTGDVLPEIEDKKRAEEEINMDYDTFDNLDPNDITVDVDTDDQEQPRSTLKRRQAKEKRKICYDSDEESEGSTSNTKPINKRKSLDEDSDWDEQTEKPQKYIKDTEKPEKEKKVKSKIAYTVIVQSYITESKMKREPIEPHELQHWLDAERNSDYFKSITHKKCKKCISEVPDNHNNLSHSEGNPFVCDICESTFPRNDEKESHVANHYYIFSCEFCRYKCYNETHMRCHVESHRRLVQCLECFAAFESIGVLKDHYNNLHRYAECDHCGKRFAHKYTVKTHIERCHNTHTCAICNKRYANYNQKMNHMRLKHRIARTEAAYCVQCDIQFDNAAQLRLHVYHNIRHKNEWRRKPPPKKEKEQHKCPECPKVYSSKHNLKGHFNLVHAKKINFYCKHCDKAFPRKYSYESHMKSQHEGYKPPKNKFCDICGRGFSFNRTLTQHIRTHTGERPFACPHCAARFTQKYPLQTHIKRVHVHVHQPSSKGTDAKPRTKRREESTFLDYDF